MAKCTFCKKYVKPSEVDVHTCKGSLAKRKEVDKDMNKLMTQVGKDVSTHKKKVLDWAHAEGRVELTGTDGKPYDLEKAMQGVKYDEGKPQWSLLPSRGLEEVVKVYTFGAKKYEANNWRKGMLWSRTFSAIMRHCWAFWAGETYDPETKLHHMAHAAFGCLTLIEYTKKKTATDDRIPQ